MYPQAMQERGASASYPTRPEMEKADMAECMPTPLHAVQGYVIENLERSHDLIDRIEMALAAGPTDGSPKPSNPRPPIGLEEQAYTARNLSDGIEVRLRTILQRLAN